MDPGALALRSRVLLTAGCSSWEGLTGKVYHWPHWHGGCFSNSSIFGFLEVSEKSFWGSLVVTISLFQSKVMVMHDDWMIWVYPPILGHLHFRPLK